MKLKELFDKSKDGKLDYQQLSELLKENKSKFVDLSEGNYVAKGKYDDDLKAKDDEIDLLNETIMSRENDLSDVKSQLEGFNGDSNTIDSLNEQLAKLQEQYSKDVDDYKARLDKQAYDYNVKDFANTKNFTSNAAKRDFIQALENAGLELKDNAFVGIDDFVNNYAKENSDAFVPEKKEEPAKKVEPQAFPKFVGPANPKSAEPVEQNEFAKAFAFTPLNAPENK